MGYQGVVGAALVVAAIVGTTDRAAADPPDGYRCGSDGTPVPGVGCQCTADKVATRDSSNNAICAPQPRRSRPPASQQAVAVAVAVPVSLPAEGAVDCFAGITSACPVAAKHYAQGDGVACDIGKALMLYRHGCDGGDAESCAEQAAVYDRSHRKENLYDPVVFNDAQTIGLIPAAAYESGFGMNAGLQLVDRDVLGAHEHISVEARVGGRYSQLYKAAVQTGNRLGDQLAVEVAGQYELRPKERFYGIGDNDYSAMPVAPVDPRIDPAVLDARYRERIVRVTGVIDLRVINHLHLRSSSELTDRRSAPASSDDLGSGSVAIDRAYDPMTLVGFDWVRDLYSELELRFDDRSRATRHEPRVFYAVGSLAAVFGGRIHRLDNAPGYWRYGIDLQHVFRVAEGPRVLALRLRGEGVTGPLTVVPFTELPQLGDADDLRGYPTGRFRDRILTVGSAEYEWEISPLVSASVFVDAGRVFRTLGDVGAGRMRVGYGVSLQIHTEHTIGLAANLASSRDGGLFLNLSFTQVFLIDELVRRR